MKKITLLVVALLFALSFQVFAAGSCTQTAQWYGQDGVKVTFTCTGDSENGSIPSYLLESYIKGMFLYDIIVQHTEGGTAPDAATVTLTMNGRDLLGGKGADIIHPTETRDTVPYSVFMTNYKYQWITDSVTLAVTGQDTASADFTIALDFLR